MTRRAGRKRGGKRPLPPRRRVLPSGVVFAIAVAILALLAGAWWLVGRRSIAPAGGGTLVVPRADFAMLKGRWQRTEGSYVIEIRDVAGDGVMEAAYFNPRPIHVASASASLEGGVTHVVMELRDVNYPGSTYRLTYDPSRDRLTGTYFQAVARETYAVSFSRLQR